MGNQKVNRILRESGWTIGLWMRRDILGLISSSQSQHQMQSRFLLDVVIRQSSAILQLFSGEDQPLLLRRDTFFILNLGLHILDRIIWFHVQRNGLSCQCFDENLHRTTSQSQHQVQGAFLLNVVVAQRSTILQLLSSKNEPLLLRWDTFFILNLGLYILNGIIWFDIQSDGLSREGLY